MEENVSIAKLREQAVQRGHLVDISARAVKRDFNFPVAVTLAVWRECIELPPFVAVPDQGERIDLMLDMIRTMVGTRQEVDVIVFEVRFQMTLTEAWGYTLKLVCDHDENGDPVFTVMFPDEQRFPM